MHLANPLFVFVAAITPTLTHAAQNDWPSCAPSCKSCGLYCNTGCSAPLKQTECDRCFFCRRESSSCSFLEIGWTTDPPNPATCAACEQGCWCRIDARCYDNVTFTGSSSAPALATGAAAKARLG